MHTEKKNIPFPALPRSNEGTENECKSPWVTVHGKCWSSEGHPQGHKWADLATLLYDLQHVVSKHLTTSLSLWDRKHLCFTKERAHISGRLVAKFSPEALTFLIYIYEFYGRISLVWRSISFYTLKTGEWCFLKKLLDADVLLLGSFCE